MKLTRAVLLVIALTSPALAQVPTKIPLTLPANWQTPSDAEIRQILIDGIDVQHLGVGIVVGVVDEHGRRIVAYGISGPNNRRALDGETVFEIGSITKVFTSLLLSDMSRGGELALTDPAAKYLPPILKLPKRNGDQIKLIDLATHTSGLPGMPANFYPIKNEGNPYVDYTIGEMGEFLRTYELKYDIGHHFEYSNFGASLLGDTLAHKAGMEFDALVHQRITGPLKMRSTAIAVSPSMKARLAVGYDEHMKPTPYWDLPAFEGAGGLHSTANDILTFLAAELGFDDTPLKGAMMDQLVPRRPAGEAGEYVALGWAIKEYPESEIFWHNGGTGGFLTFMGFDPKRRVGVVVLTNSITPTGGDDIGLHILNGRKLFALPSPK